jgi:hypothetical protein
MYYYVIDEYRVSNQLLTEDIYVRLHTYPPIEYGRILPELQSQTHFRRLANEVQALQSAVQRIEGYVRTLEEKVGTQRK